MEDIYYLQRFLEAQRDVYECVVRELSAGMKRSHWMWYIFPQIAGLGHSMMAQRYAITSLKEAAAYLEHPILGPRLRECTRLVNAVQGRGIEQIFGYPDYLKFHSSMTLFMMCSADNVLFIEAIDKYFDGKPNPLTENILKTLAGIRDNTE
jgi:uncharacterized protein (DUF1810 family)